MNMLIDLKRLQTECEKLNTEKINVLKLLSDLNYQLEDLSLSWSGTDQREFMKFSHSYIEERMASYLNYLNESQRIYKEYMSKIICIQKQLELYAVLLT